MILVLMLAVCFLGFIGSLFWEMESPQSDGPHNLLSALACVVVIILLGSIALLLNHFSTN